jgi:hypothetical protein
MDDKNKTLVRYIVGVASEFPRAAVFHAIAFQLVETLLALGWPKRILQDILQHIATHRINAGVWPGGEMATPEQRDAFDEAVVIELLSTDTSPEDGLKMFVALLTLLYISGVPLDFMKSQLEEFWADERPYHIDPKTLNGWTQ